MLVFCCKFKLFLLQNAVKSCTENEVYITRDPSFSAAGVGEFTLLFPLISALLLTGNSETFFQREQIARYRFITTGYCGECPLVLGSNSIYPEAPHSSKSQDNPPHLLYVIN